MSSNSTYNQKRQLGTLNKYRGIILAVTLFLVFNLAVLGLNFYTSSTLDSDAVSINLSGRQRMLSQRTAKVLLSIQVDAAQGKFDAKNMEELQKVSTLFDTTLNAFKTGGTVMGGNEKPVFLPKVTDTASIQAVNDALLIWQPYKKLLESVILSRVIDETRLDLATDYARENNLKLLKLMNNLTTQLEQNTKTKASHLQLIQTIALVLSLLLFANIVFNALRKLRAADGEIEKAQRETTEILNTVKEGLFLLDHELAVGSQISRSIEQILQHKVSANMPFMPILQQLVSDDIFTSSKDYIQLLFGNKVKESLMLSLNPLTQVKVQTRDDASPRYLSFQFNRVVENKQVLHLLVTVQDVTEQVTQGEELTKLKGQSSINLDLLKALLQADITQLRQFLTQAHSSLDVINEVLANADKRAATHSDMVNQCFRIIHAIKGESGAIGLQAIETLAHQFEEHLVSLRNKNEWDAQEILSLPVMLSALLEQITQIEMIVDFMQAHHQANNSPSAPQSISTNVANNLKRLVEQVSQSQNKNVQLNLELALLDQMDTKTVHQLQQIGIQLIRNAICHGIESTDIRLAQGKSAHGEISITTRINQEGIIDFIVRDDGQGIVPNRIRAAMLTSGRYASDTVHKLSDKEIVAKLFEPGFSTASSVDQDAGRGVGMDLVQSLINEIGGELKIDTKADVFTQFAFRISKHAKPSINLNSTEAVI
ncbi:ATP-binding protein [Methylotenera mobilis]|uniref:Chemotaxis protein CheA n=1 Tax=Methylotenera mobilis (strain JLW8 / ATCC BAA-1282 / DSM 17540) TaxID=583345 RepID=C6WXT9_METML|nr:ATP-binding protein [Methylotenera mobilis]ACT48738.1 CheA signal transduction histidine kinase [Methylotenera mobilis JLW8]